MNMFAISAAITTTVRGIVGLATVGLAIYSFFNKKARLRHLAELRKTLYLLKLSDPEYGAVRALYISMDAERWSFPYFDAGLSNYSGSANHSGCDHVGDHSGGGGNHH
ncbi:hypothetical protein [Bradyrhizobium cenepequi]|uniref:hypothetical protein n=1 Tax=Bradyrhizobium cenepequi TaxID=2821403 RepID=UPI001CE2D000|nr:hypothetical protein [Bradyrhizobium cenepequi]MCA6107998.1 hypothetical protein [Bradyrhizobium cenepequi]